jgi:uracil-DNA glycosylase
MTKAGVALSQASLEKLFKEIRRCTVCAPSLPLGARPIIRGRVSARLLIISQAPGTKVHETGISFNDRSGDRLRQWLAIDRDTFYDETRIAIVGMGFCYPGRDAKGGDLPPRPECAPLWHERVLTQLSKVELTLLVGSYAINYYLGTSRKRSMAETVAAWEEYLPRFMPLPHPSWRTTLFEKSHPWFEAKLLPALRRRVKKLL